MINIKYELIDYFSSNDGSRMTVSGQRKKLTHSPQMKTAHVQDTPNAKHDSHDPLYGF